MADYGAVRKTQSPPRATWRPRLAAALGKAIPRESSWSAQSAGRTRAGLAGATGLEPATSGVTGRRSNQLNYAPGTRAV